MDRGARQAIVHGVAKSWTQLKQQHTRKYIKLLTFVKYYAKCLGEGDGTHSSTLAWKIPWTEEPGRLQSMGSRRVGHD